MTTRVSRLPCFTEGSSSKAGRVAVWPGGSYVFQCHTDQCSCSRVLEPEGTLGRGAGSTLRKRSFNPSNADVTGRNHTHDHILL